MTDKAFTKLMNPEKMLSTRTLWPAFNCEYIFNIMKNESRQLIRHCCEDSSEEQYEQQTVFPNCLESTDKDSLRNIVILFTEMSEKYSYSCLV
jgi:hypothetical protein